MEVQYMPIGANFKVPTLIPDGRRAAVGTSLRTPSTLRTTGTGRTVEDSTSTEDHHFTKNRGYGWALY